MPSNARPLRIKFILPALTEAKSPFFRPIKYSLFPPLGLATLAGYLRDDDEASIQDEHVETLTLDDDPDLVVIQVYITSAHRAYEIADRYRRRGVHVAMGGLHVTSLPDEAALHADTIFLGPGEDTWPRFLEDFRAGLQKARYCSTQRTLEGVPRIRRDLIARRLYLVPNSIVVSRGCPHSCDFCYKEAFFKGGKGFYTQMVDDALAEIDRLPGRHLYFLDDHLFGNVPFATALFDGMAGMGRLWQAAGTVQSVLRPALVERAVKAGLRSLFVGFETLSEDNLRDHGKLQNLHRDYNAAIQRLHDHGVMVNGSFVFGMDGDDASVFERTVNWAVSQGIETATFHILTPYPGTALHDRMRRDGRILHDKWDLYDTRHVVYRPARLTPHELEAGYWRAYDMFYRWKSIVRGAATKSTIIDAFRHIAYAGGWKKLEPMWDLVIRARRVSSLLPVLESVLSAFGRRSADRARRTMVTSAIAAFALVAPRGAAQESTPPLPSIAFTHVTVIDGARSARVDQTVIVRGNRIVTVGLSHATRIPPGARVVNGRGKFLIPGLWDMHVHTAVVAGREVLPMYVANGVTGVRDMASDWPTLTAYREDIARGHLVGPRIIASGPYLEGGSIPIPHLLARTPDEALRAVDSLVRLGVDFVKVHGQLTRDAYFAIARRARERRIAFAGHVPRVVGSAAASDSGQRSIEHLLAIPAPCTPAESIALRPRFTIQSALGRCSSEDLTPLYARFVRNNTWVTPTFVAQYEIANWPQRTVPGDSLARYLPDSLRQFVAKILPMPDSIPPNAHLVGLSMFAKRLAQVAAMHRAGVRILAGTDAPLRNSPPGFGLHEELELLVHGGLSAEEALRAATLEPARYFEMLDSLGTIEPEKLADLVLLEANPLEDIRNTRRIAAVVANGRLYDATDRERLLRRI